VRAVTVHRYPLPALMADYARAGAGLTLTAGPLVLVPAAPVVAWALGAMAALFALFALRTATRQAGPVSCDEHRVMVAGPLGGTVPWAELRALRLAFFATRRDRKQGWMQLKLKGRAWRAITIDSAILDFDAIVRQALDAALANGIALGDTSRANLAAMGIAVAPDLASARGQESAA
jgi:hypothetical protein